MFEQGFVQVAAAKAVAIAFPLGMVVAALGGVLVWERRDHRRLTRLLADRRALRRLESKLDRLVARGEMTAPAPESRKEPGSLSPDREAAALPLPKKGSGRSAFGGAGKSELLRLIIEENVRLREVT